MFDQIQDPESALNQILADIPYAELAKRERYRALYLLLSAEHAIATEDLDDRTYQLLMRVFVNVQISGIHEERLANEFMNRMMSPEDFLAASQDVRQLREFYDLAFPVEETSVEQDAQGPALPLPVVLAPYGRR